MENIQDKLRNIDRSVKSSLSKQIINAKYLAASMKMTGVKIDKMIANPILGARK